MNGTHHIIDITAENFATLVESSHRLPVMFDFWAGWCSPCKMLLPIVEKLATEYGGKFILAKVNIDEQKAIAEQFGVRSVPTVKMVRDSQIIGEFTGAQPEAQVRAFIEQFIDKVVNQALADIEEALAEGDAGRAESLLREEINQAPAEPNAYRMLAELLIAQERLDEAERFIDTLPADLAMEDAVRALRGQLSFSRAVVGTPPKAELEAALRANPKNHQARYQLASRLVIDGHHEDALEHLLELLRSDRAYGDDIGRKAMLHVFELLGSDSELTTRYRRLMFSAMH